MRNEIFSGAKEMTPFIKKAEIRMETPAFAIMATTAGRREARVRSGDSFNLCSHKSCGVYCDGTRGHFCDGYKVGKGIHSKPGMLQDDLFLDKRHCRIASAEAECPDLEKA